MIIQWILHYNSIDALSTSDVSVASLKFWTHLSTSSLFSIFSHILARRYIGYFKRIRDQQRGRVSLRLGCRRNPHIPRCTPSPFPFHPSTPVVGSRDRIGIETLPLLYHEERTAITWRTNRRVALFNSKANKKLADRERIRQVKEEKKKE